MVGARVVYMTPMAAQRRLRGNLAVRLGIVPWLVRVPGPRRGVLVDEGRRGSVEGKTRVLRKCREDLVDGRLVGRVGQPADRTRRNLLHPGRRARGARGGFARRAAGREEGRWDEKRSAEGEQVAAGDLRWLVHITLP